MKRLALFVAAVFSVTILSSCEKEEQKVNGPNTPAVPADALHDFALIPVKDATWEIHVQGIHTPEGKIDTSFHSFTTVTALGQDSPVNGLVYHLYRAKTFAYNSASVVPSKEFLAFVREDTVLKTLFTLVSNLKEEAPLVILHDEAPGKIVNTQPQWEIKYVDSVVMAHQYLKRWQACNSYDKKLEYLYKGYGVATQTGPIFRSNIVYPGGQVVKTTFTYKNSVQEFVNNVVF